MRILIVEDEMTIAFMLEDMLIDLGHEIAEIAMRLDTALEAARDLPINLAILDLNLEGLQSYPVADVLRERGVPFAFSTGYGAGALEPGYADVPVLAKPLAGADLARFVKAHES